MSRVHRQKRDLRQVGTHRVGVVGGDAGWSELLQQHGFEIDEVGEWAGHIKDRLAGADQRRLGMRQLDIEMLARASAAIGFEELDRQARRGDTTGRRMNTA